VLNRRAAEISKQAAANRALVMGSIGPTGKMVMMGEVSPQEVFKGFIEQTMGLADGGADGIVIETMTDPEEARIAIEAAKKASELDVACTFTFSKNQDGIFRTMMGTDLEAYLEMAKLAGADIIGANCGNGTAGMIEIVRVIRSLDPDIPVLVHANAGLPIYQDGKTVFPESASEMASQMGELVAAGANIVGGCCGTTPEHIRQIIQVLSNLT
jgi:5-methyltetrahydrofolate--homocysteine methyltransferase